MPGSSGRSHPHSPSAGLVALPPLCAALCGGTAALILTGYPVPAAIVVFVSAALLIAVEAGAGEMLHAIEDPQARRLHFGWRLSSTLFDASVLLPLAWVHRAASPRVSAIALVGAGASYLVSYQLARGQGLGYSARDSTWFRVVTAALLVLALLSGAVAAGLLEAPLWVFTALAVAGAVRRAWDVRAQDRNPVASGGAA